jgi:hypothetical protein
MEKSLIVVMTRMEDIKAVKQETRPELNGKSFLGTEDHGMLLLD